MMKAEQPGLPLYDAQASGSIVVKAVLTLLGIPYTLVEGATWAEATARNRVAPVNPRHQIRFGIASEYDAPPEAFMVLELQPGYLSRARGTVKFQAAFQDA